MRAMGLDRLAPQCLVEMDREESHKHCGLGFHLKATAIFELLLLYSKQIYDRLIN